METGGLDPAGKRPCEVIFHLARVELNVQMVPVWSQGAARSIAVRPGVVLGG